MSLKKLMEAKTVADFDAAKAEAIKEIESVFPTDYWGLQLRCEKYTPENYNNIWKNELRSAIRSQLEQAGKTIKDYGLCLGDIHYIAVEIYWKSLFSSYKSNTGWRLLILSIPAIQAIAIGIASHYQNAQQHNKLGEASNLLFEIAQENLAAQGADLQLLGRIVTSDDWDKRGLLLQPVTEICGVDISGGAPNGLDLKDVRTTTVKKIIASLITLETSLNNWKQWEPLAHTLAIRINPFNDLREFEQMRSLALQDPITARMRQQMRSRSTTRSIVRIYYGPPGTGKTLIAIKEAVQLADPKFEASNSIESAFTHFNELHGQVAFITFHQSLQYEDVVESIRPFIDIDVSKDASEIQEIEAVNRDQENKDLLLTENISASREKDKIPSNHLRYYLYEGPFMRIIRRALQNPRDEHVLVIDEINRGDISRILGPLISALEPDKRAGAEFPIGFESQYPRTPDLESRIFMPSNLHIIGTMNSADRNIALVDYALRRRFDFIECPPDESLLSPTEDTPSIDVAKLLFTLNTRIKYLIDSDHCIGHGYLMNCKTNRDVLERFTRKILPLLIEYFYGNESSLLLVVGDRLDGHNNIFQIEREETQFKDLFNLDLDDAIDLGYRAHEAHISITIDPRFWNSNKLVPGPEEEAYAIKALIKIYNN